ncbi:MAG: response regulator [Methylococcaceae bacterium]|nr:response regulator [Methylococcaceae bacterium]
MSKTILIVDDSLSLRQLVSLTLKRAGYDVIEACDGKDALSKLGGSKIDLIVSDVNMPNMDGLTFLKELKQRKEYRFTPVIMLTTESAEDKMKEGQQSGARAWMVKPFKPEQMLAAVNKLTMG